MKKLSKLKIKNIVRLSNLPEIGNGKDEYPEFQDLICIEKGEQLDIPDFYDKKEALAFLTDRDRSIFYKEEA